MTNNIEWDTVLSDLTEVVQSKTDFVTKAGRVLDIGAAVLDVEHGHITRILSELDYWEVVASTDAANGLYPPGLETDLGTTFCRRTLDNQRPLALHNASTQGWANDVAYQTHELECYIGVPFEPGGRLSGTLCFVDKGARSEPFTDDELEFVDWLAMMLETEFRLQEQALALNSYQRLTGILTRVLRHNIRNELTILRGYVDLIVDQLDDLPTNSARLNTALNRVIALAEKARDLQQMAETDYELERHSIPDLLRENITEVERNYPSASISLTAPDEVQLLAYPSLDIAFHELLENAAKHAGENPTCTVTLEESSDAVFIKISDNGPGLSDHDQQVLEGSPETALRHGSGIGLWLVWWAIDSHDGTIETTVSETGTSVAVTVPHPELNRKLMNHKSGNREGI